MARIIDLPEIEEQKPDFNIPKKRQHSPAAYGCAIVFVAWLLCMAVLAVIALTGGLARLAFWAVGA